MSQINENTKIPLSLVIKFAAALLTGSALYFGLFYNIIESRREFRDGINEIRKMFSQHETNDWNREDTRMYLKRFYVINQTNNFQFHFPDSDEVWNLNRHISYP